VFEFDADLSHDPTKIPDFLKKIDSGSDMVLGSRYIPGGGIPEDWGFHRKFLSVVGNFVIMLVFTDFRVRDWTTGFRAITREVFESVRPFITSERFQGYTFQIGFLRTAMLQKYSISEVPFKFIDREYGQSKLGPEYVKNNLIYIFKTRIQEIIKSRVFKFAFVGGIGAMIQLISLTVLRNFFTYQLAFFLAIELAVFSNFLINNAWTFADRKLSLIKMPLKFLQFNLASTGSIVIQQIVALIGEFTPGLGLFALFTVPFINFTVETGTIYAVLGILIGMFWNFFAYNAFIWKQKK
jgi:dolichol-phosphate mannosyltransferase